MKEQPLLEIEDLHIRYSTREGPIPAVSGATFNVDEEEYFGLVGESGCGKSTLANAIIGGLDDNGKVTSGEIRYKGKEIQNMSESELNKEIRWSEISWIPQSSMNSLDPMEKVNEQAAALASTHTDLSREEGQDRFREMFEVVGLSEERITDYPYQFSGGMQQRAVIALALFLRPSLIIADEPTTALDVIMQDQIFKYLDRVKDLGTSMLVITHDISVVFESCDRMSIMHGGQTVEVGDVETIYDTPRHPYTVLLRQSFPDIRFPNQELTTIEGNPPQLLGDEVDFCTFADRCPLAIEECRQDAPPLESVNQGYSGDIPSRNNSREKVKSSSRNHGVHMAACFRQEEAEELHQEKNND